MEKIDKGLFISVGRADVNKNLGRLAECPVYQNHSLNMTGRNLDLNEIDRKNKILMQKL
jgi:hypothetical protein